MQVCASLLVCFLVSLYTLMAVQPVSMKLTLAAQYRPVRQTNASNEPSFFQRLKTIDWIGATLFSGSMVPM